MFVTADPATQSADPIDELRQTYQLPVLSVHAPVVLMTNRIWSTDPLVKLGRTVDLAEQLDARVVVTHPPFVWQRMGGADFSTAIGDLQDRTDVRIAVENMFPARVRGQEASVYRPHWDPLVGAGHRWYTLDLSHTATAGVDALAMLRRMGDRGSPTCIWPTAPGRRWTSIWCQVVAPNRAPMCWKCLPRNAIPGRSWWRSAPGSRPRRSARCRSQRRCRSPG